MERRYEGSSQALPQSRGGVEVVVGSTKNAAEDVVVEEDDVMDVHQTFNMLRGPRPSGA